MLFSGSMSTNYTIPSRFLSEISPELMSGYYPDPESRLARQQSWQEMRAAESGSAFADPDATARSGSARAASSGKAPARQSQYPGAGQRAATGSAGARPALPGIRTGGPDQDRLSSAGERAPDFEHLSVGDVVQHSKFGLGKLVQIIGERDKELYNVEFETAGKRLLDPRFAKLVKLN